MYENPPCTSKKNKTNFCSKKGLKDWLIFWNISRQNIMFPTIIESTSTSQPTVIFGNVQSEMESVQEKQLGMSKSHATVNRRKVIKRYTKVTKRAKIATKPYD